MQWCPCQLSYSFFWAHQLLVILLEWCTIADFRSCLATSWDFFCLCSSNYPNIEGAGRSSEIERSLMVRWVVGSILHGVDPLSYFSFQPVLHDWCNKGCGMCYPVCGMVHIKEPLLKISIIPVMCLWCRTEELFVSSKIPPAYDK